MFAKTGHVVFSKRRIKTNVYLETSLIQTRALVPTSQLKSLPFFVTAAFCVLPVETSITWVSLVGRGNFKGDEIPPPQQYAQLNDWGLSGIESATIYYYAKLQENLHNNTPKPLYNTTVWTQPCCI